MKKTTPLERAIKKAGSQVKLAHLLGVRKQDVWNWRNRESVPPLMAKKIEAATGISRASLRPDIYG